jgi:ribosomal protein RSM22 (predicted rRNA methylase)
MNQNIQNGTRNETCHFKKNVIFLELSVYLFVYLLVIVFDINEYLNSKLDSQETELDPSIPRFLFQQSEG